MSHQTLKVALVQSLIHWQDVAANIAHFREKVLSIQGADLIVLPETFTTGFSMQAHPFAQREDSQVFEEIEYWVKYTSAAIVGSLFVESNGLFYNRLFFITPEGERFFYNKRHLFSMAKEDQHYERGSSKPVFRFKGWNICPMVCYDLRFPVWCRNQLQADNSLSYDLILFVANWPDRRIHSWDVLLKARAIENLAYVVATNRVGIDGNQIPYTGHSAVYDFLGQALAYSEADEILRAELSKTALQDHRTSFPAHRDADSFTLTI
ncbi:MAG: amidohydrolase [Cytophagales bacterium]|nr:MAG: amidohydrolase [Cytophagales bacterium]TAF61508.1 MAG: amidohydrolase [Cytophagales bacterium]